MAARALWLALIFATVGPGLGGLAFIAYMVVGSVVAGDGLPSLRSIMEFVPFFWPFSWVQALIIAAVMLAVWQVVPQKRWRLLASVAVGTLGMLLATPLVFGQPLLGFVTEAFAWVLGLCAGVATLGSQLIAEAAVARAAAED